MGFGATGILARTSSGKVLIEMTSGTTFAMDEIAAAIRGKGGSVLNAPASWGTPAAEQASPCLEINDFSVASGKDVALASD